MTTMTRWLSIRGVFLITLTLFLLPLAASQNPVSGDLGWDIDEDIVQNGSGQDDLQQWKATCGDDPNEYLIREHDGVQSEMDPDLSRDNIYVCADRPTDCAFDGSVYSEGQWANVGSASGDDEKGDEIEDPEVCLDLDDSKAGGEWYDMDNDWLREEEIGGKVTLDQFQSMEKYANTALWGDNPGTDRNIDTLGYWDAGGWQETTTYQDKGLLGYSVEDDCEEDLDACSDDGNSEVGGAAVNPWFNAGNFSFSSSQDEGVEQDNYNIFYRGVHNKMQDDSDQFEPGAETEENWDTIYGSDYSFTDLEDSTPGPDNWALTAGLEKSVANDGSVYDAGQCYYRNPGDERTDKEDDSVFKDDKIFGNSYTDVVSGDGTWRNPDDLDSSQASFSCDLTGPDRGYGHDTNTGDPNDWEWKNTGDKSGNSDSKVVIGEIAWAENDFSDPLFVQEKRACGDDNREFLLEEQGEVENPPENSGRWGCSWDTDMCVFVGDDGNSFFEQGEYKNAEEPGEDSGRLKTDAEVCDKLDFAGADDDFQGTWYDQDYRQDFCSENTLYGEIGVRWFDVDYVDEHPEAVKEGIDDSLNEYLDNKGIDTYESNPDTYSGGSDETPVKTGVNDGVSSDKTASKGFCGGDDASEYLRVQRCNTDLCETDTDVLGMANDPAKCILDHSQFSSISGDERPLYDEGDEVTVAGEVMACYGGVWQEEWPVQFLQQEANVSTGTTGTVAFQIINVENEQEFQLELDFPDTSRGDELDQRTVFRESGTNSMTVQVEGQTAETYDLEVDARSREEEMDLTDVTVEAVSEGATLSGSDTAQVGFVEGTGSTSTVTQEQTRDVPGIGMIQVIVVVLLASTVFFLRSA